MNALTNKQRAVLDAIIAYVYEHGYPPTFRELCKALGLKSTNAVNDHLVRLEQKGYIKLGNFRARAIRVLDPT